MRGTRLEPNSAIDAGLPGGGRTSHSLAIKVCLVLLALVVAVGAAEVALRVFAPKYGNAANASFEFDSFRLRSHTPLTSVRHRRPDTGRPHLTLYNNLGMRQHRSFEPGALENRTVISFFGDSFTENNLIPVHTSFTEVLDFLLNADFDEFTVLNFGVDGYGTDQSYLNYQASDVAKQSALVLYLFCSNDVRNLYENGLLYVDENGRLERNAAAKPSMLVRAISRLYLTYFALDVRAIVRAALAGTPNQTYTAEDILGYQARALQREKLHSPRADQLQAKFQAREWSDVSYYIDLLLTITGQWQQAVEEQNSRFHVVLLPREEENVAEGLFADQHSVINLYDIFGRMRPGYQYDMVRFREDAHWNETGNMLAAIALYKEISPLLGRAPADDATVAARLRTYYSAFDGDWYPPDLAPRLPFTPELQAIRDKYLALERALGGKVEVGKQARAGGG